MRIPLFRLLIERRRMRSEFPRWGNERADEPESEPFRERWPRPASPCAGQNNFFSARRGGWTRGPPAEREWAVDPVGVETIRPSAFRAAISLSSIQIPIWIIRATAPLLMTTSFRQ